MLWRGQGKLIQRCLWSDLSIRNLKKILWRYVIYTHTVSTWEHVAWCKLGFDKANCYIFSVSPFSLTHWEWFTSGSQVNSHSFLITLIKSNSSAKLFPSGWSTSLGFHKYRLLLYRIWMDVIVFYSRTKQMSPYGWPRCSRI